MGDPYWTSSDRPAFSFDDLRGLLRKRFRGHLAYALDCQKPLPIQCRELERFTSVQSAMCCLLMRPPISAPHVGLVGLPFDLEMGACYHIACLGELSSRISFYSSLDDFYLRFPPT